MGQLCIDNQLRNVTVSNHDDPNDFPFEMKKKNFAFG